MYFYYLEKYSQCFILNLDYESSRLLRIIPILKVGADGKPVAGQKRKQIKEIVTQGGYRVPENIIIRPEDTDEVSK
jgi:hypothetical protein